MTDFWEVVDDTIASETAHTRQMKKDERMAACMKVVFVSEKDNGGRKVVWWRCKDPRCPNCNKLRGDELRSKISLLFASGVSLMYVRVPRDVAVLLCKSMGRNAYFRLPQSESEDDLFFLPQSESATGTIVNEDFISSFDWTECARKKCNRAVSGYLLKQFDQKEEQSPFGPYKVELQDMVAGPVEVVRAAIDNAVRQCISWRQPDNLSESQRNRDYFNGLLFQWIQSHQGKVIMSYRRSARVRSFNINWMDIESYLDNI